jgi:hypothetical protein
VLDSNCHHLVRARWESDGGILRVVGVLGRRRESVALDACWGRIGGSVALGAVGRGWGPRVVGRGRGVGTGGGGPGGGDCDSETRLLITSVRSIAGGGGGGAAS